MQPGIERLVSAFAGDDRPQRLSGASQFADALWIPPEGLRALRRGQVLDRDPVTGIEVTVAQVGRDSVVLSETGTLHRANLVSDTREGLLIGSEFESYSALVTTRISLELVRWP